MLPNNYLNLPMNLVKVRGTKVIYKNPLHFYTLATNYQKEIKKTTPFITTSKIKYLGIILRR